MISVSKARRARCPDVHRQIRRIHRKVYNAGRDQQSMVFIDRSRFLTPNSLVDKKNTHSPVNNGGGAALVANDALEGSGQVVVQTSRLQRGNEAGEASSDSSAIRPSWPGRRLMTCSRRQEGRGVFWKEVYDFLMNRESADEVRENHAVLPYGIRQQLG